MILFYQAEDGIRDIGVTGVQTCALPISMTMSWSSQVSIDTATGVVQATGATGHVNLVARHSGKCVDIASRSEERRVGKECSFRWSSYLYKIILSSTLSHFIVFFLHSLSL